MKEYKVCVCGGGSLGHVISGILGSNPTIQVNVLTGKPALWSKKIEVYDCLGERFWGKLNNVSNIAGEVIPEADIIILCLPGFLIQETLVKVQPFLKRDAKVGAVVSSNGFFWIAKAVLGTETGIFGFQRVPFIARVNDYGKSAFLKGYKSLLKIAVSGNINGTEILNFVSTYFKTETILLNNYLEASLTNSNPILHPARLYGLFKDWKEGVYYEKEPFFYEDWDDFTSQVLIECDKEFQDFLKELPLNKNEVTPLLEYYQSRDAFELTRKIKSIIAFKDIKAKMKMLPQGYIPDFNDRYFTEDIPFGLIIIKAFAKLINKETPTIDTILEWAQLKMNKEYLINGELQGKNLHETGIPQNFSFNSIANLLSN